MSKNTLIFVIALTVIIFGTIIVKGFLILNTAKQNTASAVATTSRPDNLAISDELGG